MLMLSSNRLSRSFGSFSAVDQVSFEVRQGEIVGLLGANGAGKTTLIKMLCGLLQPTSGSASVAGFDVARQSKGLKRAIGYMGQSFSLFPDLTLLENLRFFGALYGLSAGESVERGVALLKQLPRQAFERGVVANFPSGWRQMLAFSVAMLHRPGLLFLDEPTSGLDSVSRRDLWNRINMAAGEGVSVLVTTHYLDEASYCHKLLVMDQGRVAHEGSPDALRRVATGGNLLNLFLERKP
ncbi:MAG: ABC transporter ATP-binding protein [Bacteroidales bacterium]